MNWGVTGLTLANLVAKAQGLAAVIPRTRDTRKFIISVLIGANDLGGYAGATDAIAAADYTTALFAFYDNLRAMGFKVVACTILPISGGTAHNTRRAIVNANIVASVGTHCDAVADFAANATMGGDASFTNFPADWTDGTHPNAAGHVILETIYRTAVNSL